MNTLKENEREIFRLYGSHSELFFMQTLQLSHKRMSCIASLLS